MAQAAIRREGGQVFVAPEVMTAFLCAVYQGAGSNEAEARCIASRLVDSNLKGHDSHGVIRTRRYVEWARDGVQVPNRTIEILSDTGTIAIIDGHYGFGQSIGEQAVDVGVARAITHGVAVTALRHSGHLGRAGDWSERAAARNVASLHMVNVRGSLLVAPFGGRDRRMSTSPFSAGIPVKGDEPVILDFATSLVAEGKAMVALRGGKPLPDGALIDGEGRLTSDPAPLYGDFAEGETPSPSDGPGALTGFGLHKGSGLNFFMEMFAGALAGGGTAGALNEPRRRFCNGMLSIYMSADFFHSDDWMAREIKSYIEFVKSSRPTEPGGEVLVPGEKERRTKIERMATGLPLSEQAFEDILFGARTAGLTQSDIDKALGL